jgi:hypothetical protein
MVCAFLLACCWLLSCVAGIQFADICDEITEEQTTRALCLAVAP